MVELLPLKKYMGGCDSTALSRLLFDRCGDEDDPCQDRQEAGSSCVCQDDVDVVLAESQLGGSHSPHPEGEISQLISDSPHQPFRVDSCHHEKLGDV